MRSVLVYCINKSSKEFTPKYLKKILSFGSSFSESYLVLKALLVQDCITLSSWCYVCWSGSHDPMGHDIPQSPKGDTSPGLHVFWLSFLLQLAWPTPIWCTTGWKLLSCLGSPTPSPDWTTWNHPSPPNASPCSTSSQKREYPTCVNEERCHVWPELNVDGGEEVWAVLLSSWLAGWGLPTLNSLYWNYSLDLAIAQGNILGQKATEKTGYNRISSGTCSRKEHGELLWTKFKKFLTGAPSIFYVWLLHEQVLCHCVF